MSSSEFDIIRRYFSTQNLYRADVPLGIGDDAALLIPPANKLLVMSTDTLVAGVHFPLDTQPEMIGHKSLAVNLSDLAAMGAEPAWCLLNITLPDIDEEWLEKFTRGFFSLAQQYNIQLVGGDTTRGALSISVQVTGFVASHQALKRKGAQPGDGIFVTGHIGDAGLGLLLKQNDTSSAQPTKANHEVREAHEILVAHLEQPIPRIEAGLSLRDVATSAIDISDGLAADLGHILSASGVGADIHTQYIPLSAAFRAYQPSSSWQFAVNAGDDYELCFTVPADKEAAALAQLQALDCPCSRIGQITRNSGIRWYDEKGSSLNLVNSGYEHFAETNHG